MIHIENCWQFASLHRNFLSLTAKPWQVKMRVFHVSSSAFWAKSLYALDTK